MTTPRRTDEEILEEIVSNTREQIRRENLRVALHRDSAFKLDQIVETIHRNMAEFQKFSSVITAIGAKRPTPEEMKNLMGAMIPPSVSDMQNIFSGAQEVAESSRVFANDVLKDQGLMTHCRTMPERVKMSSVDRSTSTIYATGL